MIVFNMNKKTIWNFLLLAVFAFICTGTYAQPKPTPQQLAWHDMEFYLFMHFGPNTFTDLEWGKGTEKEEVFNPKTLNCEQWCRVAKAAGAKGIIITAKHHDGFCLWPSKFSKHTVRESKWKNGKGDVLKDLSAACKKYGLKFGVYISPWDRNHPDYGTEKYNDVFVGMMKELFTNYGPIWELWWDGANGEGPNGKKQVYDWKRFKETVRKLSPKTVVFSDVGPDIRWCGNEKGIAGTTNWNTLNTDGFEPGAKAPSTDTLNAGNVNGQYWIPAECDVSIRPGWFYHKAEDDKVKSPEELFQLYLKSVGRGANLLLNVPPDGNGLITKYDSAALVGFKKLRDESFRNSLLKSNGFKVQFDDFDSAVFHNEESTLEIKNISNNALRLTYQKPVEINSFVIKENLKYGQRVKHFVLDILDEQKKSHYYFANTIGSKRILTFPKISTSFITVRFTDALANPMIAEIMLYKINDNLIEK